ncbi:MAG: NADH:flavin oxidoreductase/NADH oxidase [Ferruginibacter sp.]
MSTLFTPLKIRETELKNRLVLSPMCQYSSIDGFANDWHLVHLGSRAVAAAALVMTEATAVTAEGRITPDDLGIWKDEHIVFLKRITDFIKTQKAVAGIQLAHAGRKSSHSSPWKGNKFLTNAEGGWQSLAPSAIPYKAGEPLPTAMSSADISQLVKDFSQAARRSIEAGFEIIEIHAAHGYLINEFLSPLSNQRTDEYGGNFTNRTRLLKEIVIEIRKSIPKTIPLFVRISATDWMEDGWNLNDSVELAKILQPIGVDLIDCSSGGNATGQKIPVAPLYQVSFSEQIKQQAGILTAAVGLITTSKEAEETLRNNQADLIFLGRAFLRDPYFPLHAAKELNVEVDWPVQYQRAKSS